MVIQINAAMPKVGNPANDYRGQVGSVDTWTIKENGAGHQHRLWATVRNGLPQIWLASNPEEVGKLMVKWNDQVKAKGADPKFVAAVKRAGELLDKKTTAGKSVKDELGDVAKAIVKYEKAYSLCQNGKSKNTARNELSKEIQAVARENKELEMALRELGDQLEIIQTYMPQACFAAGTKLYAKGIWGIGYRKIEEITPEDWVLSRDEHAPESVASWKRVEESFTRFGLVLDLVVEGQTIRTTGEHPFYVEGQGWSAANTLEPGSRILSLNNDWLTVDAVTKTNDWETVYNLRVEDWHTYFVGDDDWAWAVWSHNHTACALINFRADNDLPKITPNEADPDQNSYRGTVAYVKLAKNRFQYGLNPNAGGRERLQQYKLLDDDELERFRQIINTTPGRTFDEIPQVLRHAEFAALYLANEHFGTLPSRIKMDTDRRMCPFKNGCMENLHRILSALGIKELLIRDNYGDVYQLTPNQSAKTLTNLSLSEWDKY